MATFTQWLVIYPSCCPVYLDYFFIEKIVKISNLIFCLKTEKLDSIHLLLLTFKNFKRKFWRISSWNDIFLFLFFVCFFVVFFGQKPNPKKFYCSNYYNVLSCVSMLSVNHVKYFIIHVLRIQHNMFSDILSNYVFGILFKSTRNAYLYNVVF